MASLRPQTIENVALPKTILIAEHLSRVDSVTGTSLINQVSLSISGGDRIGLIGPSGSGKTVLLRSLAMLDELATGDIVWQGARVEGKQVPQYRSQVCYLSQHITPTDETTLEYLQLPFGLAIHRDKTFNQSKIESWIERCELPISLLDAPASQLSGGERQIFAIIRTLQFEPRIVLFDEATASMDEALADAAEKLISGWYSECEGRAYIWTSHSKQQVARMTTQEIALENGRRVAAP